ncbi:MAG: carboxymuconolactone decarboxylase family protein, partial [Steroidobacteraceae bacterium]
MTPIQRMACLMMALLVSGAAAAQERMPPIPPDKMTDAQQKVVADVVSGPRGRLSPPFVPILRSPELLSRLQRVGEYLIYHNSLDPRIFELVVMMMARNWTQQFEWRHHYPLALKAGVKQETIDA